jgi:hypothetical protein
MRIFSLFLLLGLVPASAEVLTLVTSLRSGSSSAPALSTVTITLAEGDVATAKYLSETAFLDTRIGGTLYRVGPNDPNQDKLPVIAGPATIQLSNFSISDLAIGTIEIKRTGTPASTPANVIVIPDDGNGDHEVFLESSPDLVTWTNTLPGTFNSRGANRFFRVRVRKTRE